MRTTRKIVASPLSPVLQTATSKNQSSQSPLAKAMKLSIDAMSGSSSVMRTTRSGLATCIGPDGTLQWGPHNLCGESDSLLGWAASLLTNSVAFATTAFDGGQYALKANSVSPITNFSKAFTSSATKMSLSVDVKRGNFDTGNGCYTYGFYNSSTVVDLAYITVNYATGAVALTGPQAATSIAYSKDLGNGWFRIGITVTSGIAPGQTINTYLGGVGSTAPAGLFWYMARVMVNNGTSMEYVNSTVSNRLGYPNDFTNALWVKPGAAMQVYEKTCTGPNGQPATTLVASVANSEIFQSVAISGACTTGFLIRRRLGTGAISLRSSANSAWLPQPITTDWAFYQNDGGVSGGTAYCDLLMSTAGDQIDICDARLVPGTGTPTYGSELAPALVSGAWSTVQSGWTVSGGVATVNSAIAGSTVFRSGATKIGGVYKVTYTVSSVSGTGVAAIAGGAGFSIKTSPGTYTDTIIATDTSGIGIYASGSNTVATITSVSISEITYGPIPYSYNAAAAPAVGPIYGQRTDYDVSTVSGIGPNLIANGDITLSATNWTTGGANLAATASGGVVTNSGAANGYAYQVIPTVIGKAYRLSGRMTPGTGSTNPRLLAGTGVVAGDLLTLQCVGEGVYANTFVASSAFTWITITTNSVTAGAVATFVGVVVQEAFAGAIAGYGPELVTNGDFTNGVTGWSNAASGSISNVGGALRVVGDGVSNWTGVVATSPSLFVGKQYLLTFTVANGVWTSNGGGPASSSANAIKFSNGLDYYYPKANGTFTVPFTVNTTGAIRFVAGDGPNDRADFDNISIKEIQFASRAALIEPTQVTQLLANPDDLSASPWGGPPTRANDGTKFRGRPMWKLTKTTVSGSESYSNTAAGAQAIGYYTEGFAFLASPNSNQVDFGLLGGTSTWGAAGDTVCSIDSGPGTLTQQVGGLWRIVGLSTNVPTVVTMTRNLLVSETIGVFLYPDTSLSTTIGKAVYVQVDNLEAGRSKTSFIPNPATSGTVVRVADTSSVGYDDLAKALPWLMDSNLLTFPEDLDNAAWIKSAATISPNVAIAPDGTMTADKLVVTSGQAGGYFYRPGQAITIGAPNTQTIFLKAGEFTSVVLHSNMTGAYKNATLDLVTGAVSANTFVTPPTMTAWPNGWWRMTLTEIATVGSANILYIDNTALVGDGVKGFYAWGGTCAPGPVAQTYYPQASKQATIVFEGDLTYGAASGGMSLFALENGASNRVELYKGSVSNTLSGLFNANSGSPGNIMSGTVFKSLIGFSPSSAGTVLNGGAEIAITASAFAAAPNILKIGNDAVGSAASSMHLRRLRIFNTNLPASAKQSLTR